MWRPYALTQFPGFTLHMDNLKQSNLKLLKSESERINANSFKLHSETLKVDLHEL
jgi:hypothetical protein